MAKIIKLTERDLSRIVKRVIREQEEEQEIASKVEKILEKPSVEMKIEDVYSNMSDSDKDMLKDVLNNLGINANSSPKEVHDKIENKVGTEVGGEMSEEDETPRNKAARILHNIGAGNIAAWGGVPAAIAIGGLLAGTVGAPMVAGFAISWGATALLMGLAKLLEEDSPSSETPSSDKKDLRVFTRNASGEETYHDEMKGDDLSSEYKRTMDENYRRRQYQKQYRRRY